MIDVPAPAEEKNLAIWGIDVPDNLVIDQKKLAAALRMVSCKQMIPHFVILCKEKVPFT